MATNDGNRPEAVAPTYALRTTVPDKDAKGKLGELKKSKYVEDIGAATDVLAQAAIDCRTAARLFTNAIKELMRRGAPALNVSSKSRDTAVISEVVTGGSEQRQRLLALHVSAQQLLQPAKSNALPARSKAVDCAGPRCSSHAVRS
jgi:hypothetical protein